MPKGIGYGRKRRRNAKVDRPVVRAKKAAERAAPKVDRPVVRRKAAPPRASAPSGAPAAVHGTPLPRPAAESMVAGYSGRVASRPIVRNVDDRLSGSGIPTRRGVARKVRDDLTGRGATNAQRATRASGALSEHQALLRRAVGAPAPRKRKRSKVGEGVSTSRSLYGAPRLFDNGPLRPRQR